MLFLILVIGGVLALFALGQVAIMQAGDSDLPPIPKAGSKGAPVDVFSLVSDLRNCFIPETPIARTDIEVIEDVDDYLPTISQTAETLRGLSFEEEVSSEFLSQDEFEAKLSRNFERNTNIREIQRDEAILTMLRAIPSETDLMDIYENLSTESFTGLYLPNKKKLLVAVDGSGLAVFEEDTLAHELGHAVVDQAIGLPRFKKIDRANSDKAVAVRALVEGDATLLALQYDFNVMSVPRAHELLEESSNFGTSSEVPYFLQRSLDFSYNEGALFACYLYSQGGWDAVNEAYQDSPEASADILFPHRYEESIVPQDPVDPARPGPDWKRVEQDGFGATDLLWLFQAPLGEPRVALEEELERVLSWNGGEYHVYRNQETEEIALHVGLVDGGVKVSPAGTTPSPLIEEVMKWIDDAFPTARFFESGPDSTIWRDEDTHYVLTTDGRELGLSAARSYPVANALADGNRRDLPKKLIPID